MEWVASETALFCNIKLEALYVLAKHCTSEHSQSPESVLFPGSIGPCAGHQGSGPQKQSALLLSLRASFSPGGTAVWTETSSWECWETLQESHKSRCLHLDLSSCPSLGFCLVQTQPQALQTLKEPGPHHVLHSSHPSLGPSDNLFRSLLQLSPRIPTSTSPTVLRLSGLQLWGSEPVGGRECDLEHLGWNPETDGVTLSCPLPLSGCLNR